MPANAHSPAVWFPAPLIVLASFLLGSALNYWFPAQIQPPWILWSLGWLYNLAGIGLDLWCYALFRQCQTAILPIQGARYCVAAGPYRFSRNPMYLGLLLIHLGASLATGIFWHVALFPIVLLTIRFYVIAREEVHLAARFGNDYRRYCNQVSRWF